MESQTHRHAPALHLIVADQQVVLVAAEQLRDKPWAECFGEVQEALAWPDGRTLTLDLRQTRWADPTPLLALAILVEQWRQGGSQIVIALADPSASLDKGADFAALVDHQELAKFLIFLERDGFLAVLAGVATAPDGATAGVPTKKPMRTTIRLGTTTVSDLGNLRRRLHTESPILPIPVVPAIHAHLFDMGQNLHASISDLADALIAEAESSGLKRHFDRDVYSDPTTSATPLGARDLSPEVFVQELRQFFIELLDNVKEHAYAGLAVPRLAAVYARFRLGLQDPRAAHLRPELIKLQQDEEKFCPRIGKPEAVEQTGFMEIFVADAGIGLATDLKRALDHKKLRGDRKHPLKTFFTMLALGNGFSSDGELAEREQAGKSLLPGLQHVCRLLERGHGLFRALDHAEWAAARWPPPLPEPGRQRRWDPQFSETVSANRPVVGTYILIRASTGEPKELEAPWAPAVLSTAATLAPEDMLAAWTDDPAARGSWRRVTFAVVDEEQGRWRDADGRQQRGFEVGGVGNPYRCVLWRPARSLRRNEIRSRLQEIGRESEHVIIADQDIATALMTEWTLRQMVLTGATTLRRVSIISNNLVAVDLLADQPDSRGGRRLCTEASSLLATRPTDGMSLPHVIAALRYLDGALFWSAVRKNDERFHLLLRGRIHWTRTASADTAFHLEMHLDFTQVLHVKLCRWVCRRALSRFLAYCSPSEAPIPIDLLVDPLLNSFLYSNNTEYGAGSPSPGPAVLLGSMLMSWGSLRRRRHLAEMGERLETPVIAYLLQHPRTRQPKQNGDQAMSLIPWLEDAIPPAEPQLGDTELQRVTDTPIVAPGGTRYWRAYRRQGTTSLYGGSPDFSKGISVGETYGSWESRGLLRLGHWHHGSSHDFVGVDLLSAIRLSRVEPRSTVWTFLRGHFQRLGDGYRKHAGFLPCDLLACVPNEGTNLILNRAVEEMAWLEAKTVYLPLVQRQRSGMRLRISPVALEAARRRVQSERATLGPNGKVRVLLLDTVFADVRTFFELINTLREIGADEVDTLALLDRTRMPNDIASFRRGWHRHHARLWRLDVDSLAPSLGPSRSAGCPLCAALEELANTTDEVPDRIVTARHRLAVWNETMRVRTLSKVSPLAGLPAVKLSHPIPVGFGHDIDKPEKEDRVAIFEAAALASILLEAVTITGVHESVLRTLNEVRRFAPAAGQGDADSRLSWQLAARLYVLIGQALLMRHDTELDRRVIVYRGLLEVLFECRKTAPATAFGALVLAAAGDAILRTLLPDIESHLEKSSPNFDLALALAMMARRYDGLRRLPQVGVFLSLLGGRRDDAPSTLREIFLVVGSRDGEVHVSELRRQLADGSRREPLTLGSLVEGLIANLKHLRSLDAWLPRSGIKERIAGWIAALEEAAQGLRGASSEEVSRSSQQLFHILYGDTAAGGSVYRQLQEAFSVNAGQVERLLDGLRPETQVVLERAGIRNFPPETVAKVRALYLLPIMDCLHEVFDNAVKHRQVALAGKTDAGGKVRWSCTVDGEAIVVEVRNPCDEHAPVGRPSQKQGILEYLGGRVTSEVRRDGEQAEFVCRVQLPTLLDLVHSLGTGGSHADSSAGGRRRLSGRAD